MKRFRTVLPAAGRIRTCIDCPVVSEEGVQSKIGTCID